jgi:formate C-acetyltransferase
MEKAEQTTDPARKAELKEMAESLYWISVNPARTFWEACEATLLYTVLMYEDCCAAFSIGRFDQFTYKQYKADVDAAASRRSARRRSSTPSSQRSTTSSTAARSS